MSIISMMHDKSRSSRRDGLPSDNPWRSDERYIDVAVISSDAMRISSLTRRVNEVRDLTCYHAYRCHELAAIRRQSRDVVFKTAIQSFSQGCLRYICVTQVL